MEAQQFVGLTGKDYRVTADHNRDWWRRVADAVEREGGMSAIDDIIRKERVPGHFVTYCLRRGYLAQMIAAEPATSIGPVLDALVAKAEGLVLQDGAWYRRASEKAAAFRMMPWSPTTIHAQGHPILEREHIGTMYHCGEWHAFYMTDEDDPCNFDWMWSSAGPSPLVAGLRCYALRRFGHEKVVVPCLMNNY